MTGGAPSEVPAGGASSGGAASAPELRCWAPAGVREVRAGDDLAALVADAVGPLLAGDIVVVSSKVVSKAEGRVVVAADREQAITDETVRVVATRRQPDGRLTRIVENRLGIVGAAAGVDASNVAEGTVLLLPQDPDASADRICAALRDRFGMPIGVVISDTLGRPWRQGQTDVAIGAAGLAVVDDLRGQPDAAGRRMDVTVVAVADEIAAAADLVKGKTGGRPIAVVRGLGRFVGERGGPGARTLNRSGPDDMFRLGTAEAYAEGLRAAAAAPSASTAVPEP